MVPSTHKCPQFSTFKKVVILFFYFYLKGIDQPTHNTFVNSLAVLLTQTLLHCCEQQLRRCYSLVKGTELNLGQWHRQCASHFSWVRSLKSCVPHCPRTESLAALAAVGFRAAATYTLNPIIFLQLLTVDPTRDCSQRGRKAILPAHNIQVTAVDRNKTFERLRYKMIYDVTTYLIP